MSGCTPSTRTGRRGVVFCSLDASRLCGRPRCAADTGPAVPVLADARLFNACARRPEFGWTTTTRWPGPPGVSSRVAVRVGDPLPADDGLAEFLTARWGLHTAVFGRRVYVPNHHEPWALRSAEVLLLDDGLLAAAGFPTLADRPPDHVCFARASGRRSGFRACR